MCVIGREFSVLAAFRALSQWWQIYWAEKERNKESDCLYIHK